MWKSKKGIKVLIVSNVFSQENIVQILSADMIPDLIAGSNFHLCKKGKCLILVSETLGTALQKHGC
jgi:hypothetical protein